MTIDRWIQLLGIVVPLVSAVAVARMAIAKASADADRESIKLVRERQHKLTQELQGMPSTLRPFFVDRGEWGQAERAHELAHQTIHDRLAAVEARK